MTLLLSIFRPLRKIFLALYTEWNTHFFRKRKDNKYKISSLKDYIILYLCIFYLCILPLTLKIQFLMILNTWTYLLYIWLYVFQNNIIYYYWQCDYGCNAWLLCCIFYCLDKLYKCCRVKIFSFLNHYDYFYLVMWLIWHKVDLFLFCFAFLSINFANKIFPWFYCQTMKQDSFWRIISFLPGLSPLFYLLW